MPEKNERDKSTDQRQSGGRGDGDSKQTGGRQGGQQGGRGETGKEGQGRGGNNR